MMPIVAMQWFTFILILSSSLELEHSKLYNIAHPLKMKAINLYVSVYLDVQAYEFFFFFHTVSSCPYSCNVDGINAISVRIRSQTCQTFDHKIKGK